MNLATISGRVMLIPSAIIVLNHAMDIILVFVKLKMKQLTILPRTLMILIMQLVRLRINAL